MGGASMTTTAPSSTAATFHHHLANADFSLGSSMGAASAGASSFLGAAETLTAGGGHMPTPSSVTVMPRMTSSSSSRTSTPVFAWGCELEEVDDVLPKSCEAWPGRRPAGPCSR